MLHASKRFLTQQRGSWRRRAQQHVNERICLVQRWISLHFKHPWWLAVCSNLKHQTSESIDFSSSTVPIKKRLNTHILARHALTHEQVPAKISGASHNRELLDDGGVTFCGGNENWRNAIVIALGHVALAGNKLLDAGGMTALPPPSYFKLALSFEAGRPFSACPKSERNGVHVERVTQGGTCKPRRARA
jgi:hypothetical protein